LAPQSSWERIRPAKFRASVDLTGLVPGLYDVPITVEVSDSYVTVVEKRPGSVSIRLEPLLRTQVPIRVDVIDSAPIGYIARAPVFSPVTATVSGPSSLVTQVSQAVAELYLRNAKETVRRTVDLVARNANGDLVSRVTLDPAKIDASVPIEQRFGYRDMSVRVLVDGEVAPGYWINNITADPSTVTVVGGPTALRDLPGYVETSPVDVTDATADIVERVALDLPQGVSVVQPETGESQSTGGVQVSIEVSTVAGGQTVQRQVTFQGLAETQTAVARPSQVDVILSGPLPRLQTLTLQDVRVTVDLFGLGVGTHMVKPVIVVPESLRAESVLPETIEVQISWRSTASPVAPAPTATEPGTRIATTTPTPDKTTEPAPTPTLSSSQTPTSVR